VGNSTGRFCEHSHGYERGSLDACRVVTTLSVRPATRLQLLPEQ
jgi:hypothetical protein